MDNSVERDSPNTTTTNNTTDTQTNKQTKHRRIASDAPDADACRAQLDAIRARLLGRSAAYTLVAPCLLGEIVLAPVDPGAPAPAGGRLEPPQSHWDYAVRRAALSAAQEELALALLDGRAARMDAIAARRARCRAALAAAPAPLEEDRLLQEMAAINVLDVTTYAATNLVLYDSIMTAEQFGAFVVGCFPHVPPVEAVGERERESERERERRGQQCKGGGEDTTEGGSAWY